MNAGEQSIVADWLRTLGLAQYAESFVDNGYDDLEICKQIGEPDLDAIGVSDPKHRHRVLQAVRVLLEQGGTAVYFTLEEAAKHSRVSAASEYGFDGEWAPPPPDKAAVVRPDSLRYFQDEYEEGKAELVRFPKMQLKIMVREKTVRDGIRLSMQPYSNPDGSRGDLDGLARQYAEELRTHFQDVLERLEELRKRRVAADFAQLPDDITNNLGYRAPRFYRPGKYMPSSCVNEPEDDSAGVDPYGVYGVRLGPFMEGAGSPQRCLSPRSKYFYEPCPFSASECREGGAEPGGRSKKGSSGGGGSGGGTSFGRLFRTLGSKKERCKTSPRHLASSRLRPIGAPSQAACRVDAAGAQLPWAAAPAEVSAVPSSGLQQPGMEEELLNDERCLQLVLAVREGHVTGDQALQRLRQRDTLRFRNNRNREELLNDFARMRWNQGAPKKAQANSVFYTDGLSPAPSCLAPCRGVPGGAPTQQPIYYEPPDAVGPVATASPLRAAAPGSGAPDRCCSSGSSSSAGSSSSSSGSTAPRPNAIVSPFRNKPPTDSALLAAPAYGSSTGTEVCDGNCGNIMCSVRASADSPPSSEPATLLPPGSTTELAAPVSLDVNDDDDASGTVGGDAKLGDTAAGNKAGCADGAQRTVPDVAHDSELKRAALAAAAAAGNSERPVSDDVRGTTLGAAIGSTTTAAAASVTGAPSVESSANVRVVTMLGKLRGRTPTRNSYSASEEGHSQSSDCEDPEEAEKQQQQQMGEVQKVPDQQLRNTLVGRVRHLHKDVKKKISRFRNSRSSVDGTMEDRELPDDVLQPGSSVESIPSGSAGSRSSIQAHTPTSSNRSSSSIGEEECNPQCFGPFVGRARALVDCVPSPYDKDGLAFKKGDIIDILSKNTTGTWVGVANKKVGHFKFINVEEIPTETKPRQRRFPSVPKLEQRPESLEELLGIFSLQNYVNVFMLHGYQDLDTFKEITKEDLESLGISNGDHQMQILRAVEALLEHDGVILGEYLEAPSSPELPPVKEGDCDLSMDSAINDLDSAPSGSFHNDHRPFTMPGDRDSSLNNGSSSLLRFQMNIPVPEPESPPAPAPRCDDFKEGLSFNGTNTPPLPTSVVSAAVERFELRRASADCIRNHIPKSLQNVFRKLSGNVGEDDGRSASFDDDALSESPAKTSYGSSFARKVKASAFLRRDSNDVRGKLTDRKSSLHSAEETAAAAALSLHTCIEHKLAAEGIDLCQEPYTDRTGFCGIPPALVQRYSQELQRDIAETAEALDQIRITGLDRIGKQGVPNDFLADSCRGIGLEADYSGGLRPWLVSLGLPMYEPLFLEARLSDLARIAQLQEADLRALGISNVLHLRHLAEAIDTLQLEHSRYGIELR